MIYFKAFFKLAQEDNQQFQVTPDKNPQLANAVQPVQDNKNSNPGRALTAQILKKTKK